MADQVSHAIENAEVVEERKDSSGEIKSILVEAPDFEWPEWIPYSQVHEDSEVHREGDSGTLLVNEWLAEKRGWL